MYEIVITEYFEGFPVSKFLRFYQIYIRNIEIHNAKEMISWLLSYVLGI